MGDQQEEGRGMAFGLSGDYSDGEFGDDGEFYGRKRTRRKLTRDEQLYGRIKCAGVLVFFGCVFFLVFLTSADDAGAFEQVFLRRMVRDVRQDEV